MSLGMNPANTLYITDIPLDASEQYLFQIFNTVTHEINGVKLIRDKITNASLGYGFIEFKAKDVAESILRNFNDKPIAAYPGKVYRLNWSNTSPSYTTLFIKPSDISYSVWVGDLDANVTDQLLEATFRAKYNSVQSARVVTDPLTQRPKGFGFIKFGDEIESKAAIAQMQGTYILSRPIRLNSASRSNIVPSTNITPTTGSTPYTMLAAGINGAPPIIKPMTPFYPAPELTSDPNNTTVYVGNIDATITADMLKATFEPFGPIQSIKLPAGKACAFVQYLYFQHANLAVQHLHGAMIGNSRMRLAWGHAGQTAKVDPYGMMGLGMMGMGFDMYAPLNPNKPPAINNMLPPPSAPSIPQIDPSTVIDTSYKDPRSMNEDERNTHFTASRNAAMNINFYGLTPFQILN